MVDFIVVGAGSAGCVVAARLSEDPSVSVLLLEAGKPDKQQEIHIPAAFSKLFHTEYDWDYRTVPQSQLDNRELYWPRGKVLGGSSTLNAMIRGYWLMTLLCPDEVDLQAGAEACEYLPGQRRVRPLHPVEQEHQACEDDQIDDH